jgi:hypothetical protein
MLAQHPFIDEKYTVDVILLNNFKDRHNKNSLIVSKFIKQLKEYMKYMILKIYMSIINNNKKIK